MGRDGGGATRWREKNEVSAGADGARDDANTTTSVGRMGSRRPRLTRRARIFAEQLGQGCINANGLPVDLSPLHGAQLSPFVDHEAPFNRVPVPPTLPTPPSLVLWEVGDNNDLNAYGFSRDELQGAIAESTLGWSAHYELASTRNTGNSRPFLLSTPTTPTLVGMDGEEDDLDEEGFSRRDQRKAMAESEQTAPSTVARPFYGTSTGTIVNGALSWEEWDMLEQFEAVPPSPKKMVQPQSPTSMRVETEIAVPCWLSSPLASP